MLTFHKVLGELGSFAGGLLLLGGGSASVGGPNALEKFGFEWGWTPQVLAGGPSAVVGSTFFGGPNILVLMPSEAGRRVF